MPSTLTHEYFYRDVYHNTNKNFKKTYNEHTYRNFSVGSQGHDALFFYNFWNLPKFMERRNIAIGLQNNKFQEVCEAYIKSIHNNELENSKESKLILYGYILHHILDSYTHPYIIYESEREHLHEQVESFLDEWFIEKRENKNPHLYPVHRLIPQLPKIDEQTKTVISEAFNKTYNLEEFGKIYIGALKQVRLFLRLFRYDITGIKKLGYNIIDHTHITDITFSWLSYKTKYPNYEYYLNEEQRAWINPIDKDKISTDSFMDLYYLAIYEAAEIISRLEESIKDQATEEEIKSIIPDTSAVHGLECGRSLKFQI